jgi:hypothetical protein
MEHLGRCLDSHLTQGLEQIVFHLRSVEALDECHKSPVKIGRVYPKFLMDFGG